VLACGLLAGVTCADDGQKKAKKGGPEATFKKLDSNSDGKITKDEFAKFAESNPKAKSKPGAIDKRFQAMDANGDGAVSLEEFQKFGQKKKKDGK
jgi:Ca2+-binding EF-hand superfamily protein